MSQERAKSRPGHINCNDLDYRMSRSFFLFYLTKFVQELQALAVQIFKMISDTVDVCLKSGTE